MFELASFVTALVTIGTLMIFAWVISLWKRDASIADALWAILFVTAALTYYATAVETGLRGQLVLFLVIAWGFRLSLHIAWRNRGQPEDSRYQAIRSNNQPHFWLKSLYIVFGLQGLLAAIISIPLMIGVQGQQGLGALDFVAVALWLIGMVFEVIGDWQLAAFRRSPANAGRVLDTGLWRYTRHPNYFGEFCIWWGFYLLAVPAGGWWTIFSPLLMTWLLLRVSGVALLERDIGQRRPEYRDYIRRTSAFLPRPPRDMANPGAAEEITQPPASRQEPSAQDPSPASRRPRVFYDGGCPLCRREIDHYRRLDRQQQLEWIDITQQSDALVRNGLSYEQAMARFHVLDSSGRWQTGAHGFAELWSHLPYFRWLAWATRNLGLLTPLDVLYRHFARWRARRRCDGNLCSNQGKEA